MVAERSRVPDRPTRADPTHGIPERERERERDHDFDFDCGSVQTAYHTEPELT